MFGGLIQGIFGGRQTVTAGKFIDQSDGPVVVPQQEYNDDYSFCRSFNGKNVVVTGSTGAIGTRLVQAILRHSKPNKLALFLASIETRL